MKERLKYIDIFRGLGIVLMVMGHIWFGKSFDHFIHAFHMPMFFFISGFLFISKSPDELRTVDFIKRKCITLLVPYLFWGIFHYVFYNTVLYISRGGGWKPRHYSIYALRIQKDYQLQEDYGF